MEKEIFIKDEIINQQYNIMGQINEIKDAPRKYFVVTYGCQMNVNDSEKISGMLEAMGMQKANEKENADFVIFNTCCIRENAERRALGNINWLNEVKKKNNKLIIAVCGCMVQQPEMSKAMLKKYKFIDIAFGTHNLHLLPSMMLEFLNKRKRLVKINDNHIIAENMPIHHDYKHSAYISIIFGCNNFCTYCIVPYVRGRERSRRFEDILREAEKLKNDGVKEIILLGQNVNSYGLNNAKDKQFPALIKKLDEMEIPRIRFMTPHPKDLSDDLIEVMANSKHIESHVHLPVQSGSTRILNAMNRRYTAEQYRALVDKIKNNIPNVGITTDIIVGFPGETDSEFQETINMAKYVQYDSAFTFIYSPRKGTRAAELPGFLPDDVAHERLARLNKVTKLSTKSNLDSMVGTTVNVLVDNVSKRNENEVSGKCSRYFTVTIPGSKNDIGEFIKVKIDKAGINTLKGKRI